MLHLRRLCRGVYDLKLLWLMLAIQVSAYYFPQPVPLIITAIIFLIGVVAWIYALGKAKIDHDEYLKKERSLNGQ